MKINIKQSISNKLLATLKKLMKEHDDIRAEVEAMLEEIKNEGENNDIKRD